MSQSPEGNAVALADVYRSSVNDELVRVLYEDPTRGEFALIRLGASAQPFRRDAAEFRSDVGCGKLVWTDDHPYNPPFLRSRPPEAVKEEGRIVKFDRPKNATGMKKRPKERSVQDKRARIIGTVSEDGWFDVLEAGGWKAAIDARCSETGVGRRTVERTYVQFFTYGMIPAALFCKEGRGSPKEVKNYSKKPGRPTAVPVGLPLTLKVRGHFEWAKKWLVENNSAPKLDGYDKMCDRFYSDGFTELEGIKIASHLPKDQRPTERQFLDWMGVNLPHMKRKRRRMGEAAWRNDVAPVAGTTANRVFRPGSRGQVDSSPLPYTLVDPTRRMYLDDLRVYGVRDDNCNMLELFATFGPENTEDTLAALVKFRAATFLGPRKPGGKPAASVKGFCFEDLYSDKGSAFVAEACERMTKYIRGGNSNPGPGKPRNRGAGEQDFNMLQDFLNWIPGAYATAVKKANGGRRSSKPCLTLMEFQSLCDEYSRLHNNTRRSNSRSGSHINTDGSQMTPFEALPDGFARGGLARRPALADLRMALCESIEATISPNGLGYDVGGAFYRVAGDSTAGNGCEGADLSRGGGRAKGKWIVLRNRRSMARAWLLRDGDPKVELVLQPIHEWLAPMAVGEFERYRKLKIKGDAAGAQVDRVQKRAAKARTESIVALAVSAGTTAKPSPHAKRIQDNEAAKARAKALAPIEAADPIAVPVPAAIAPERESFAPKKVTHQPTAAPAATSYIPAQAPRGLTGLAALSAARRAENAKLRNNGVAK